MAPLVLSTHTGRPVTVDHCRPCRQVWFDTLESVQLDGLGWVKLLREMQASTTTPPEGAGPAAMGCPRCQRPLRAVNNLTRFGRFVMLECPQRHGHLHSHAGVLAERGLVRPLLGPERKALREERHRISCFNCGAPADGAGDQCSYCGTTLVVLDLPRLASSLKPKVLEQPVPAATAAPEQPAQPARSVAWACRGCGASLDPSRDAACTRCGHPVVALELPDIGPLLDAAEDELIAAAAALARRRRRPEPGTEPAPAAALDAITVRVGSGPAQPLLAWLDGPLQGGWTPLWLALVLSLLAAWAS